MAGFLRHAIRETDRQRQKGIQRETDRRDRDRQTEKQKALAETIYLLHVSTHFIHYGCFIIYSAGFVA